ncbi:MAG: PAS domain-containing protein [Anaerolineae bacterium]|nr:PAS domain-containing protein [Anaerolineae bacterium]
MIKYKSEIAGKQESGSEMETLQQDEAALREQEQRYRILFENMAQGVFYQNADRELIDANTTALELLGLTQEEFLNRTSEAPEWDIIDENGEKLPADQQPSIYALKSGQPVKDRTLGVYNPQKEDYVWMNVNAIPLYKPGEKLPYQVLVTLHDITEVKRTYEALEQAEREKALILNSTAEMFAYYDKELRIQWANKASGDSVHMTIEELIGLHCYEIWHQRNTPCEGCPVLKALETGAPQETEMETPDGRYWRVRGYPVFDDAGQICGLIEYGQDITHQKQVEIALKEYSEKLEMMVKERTEELQQAQEQLVRREKLASLGQLAGGVGHELRTPLNIIANAAYYLKATCTKAQTDEATQQYLEMIIAEVKKSERIVHDLLDFARIKPLEKIRIPVKDLVAQVILRQSQPNHIQIETDIAPTLTIYTDPQQMEQVLTNLISNAYEAMPDGGSLLIKAEGKEEQTQISVIDTGDGIPREHIDKLFEPLFTTKENGVGLGLAITSNLVEVNGGQISVESEPGKGTVFTLTLPA